MSGDGPPVDPLTAALLSGQERAIAALGDAVGALRGATEASAEAAKEVNAARMAIETATAANQTKSGEMEALRQQLALLQDWRTRTEEREKANTVNWTPTIVTALIGLVSSVLVGVLVWLLTRGG